MLTNRGIFLLTSHIWDFRRLAEIFLIRISHHFRLIQDLSVATWPFTFQILHLSDICVCVGEGWTHCCSTFNPCLLEGTREQRPGGGGALQVRFLLDVCHFSSFWERIPQLVILQIISSGGSSICWTKPATTRSWYEEAVTGGTTVGSPIFVFAPGVALWNIKSWQFIEATGVLFCWVGPVGNGSKVQRPCGKWRMRNVLHQQSFSVPPLCWLPEITVIKRYKCS